MERLVYSSTQAAGTGTSGQQPVSTPRTFDNNDAALLKSMHAILANQQEKLIAAFYDHLLRFPDIRPLLGDDAKLARLKRAQTAYFSQLTEGCYDQSYVENRLHVGVAHQRVGLTPKWYMSAYCKYLSEVIPLVFDHYADEPERRLDACRALFKIIFFDMGLALDTYFHAEHKALTLAQSYTEQIVSNMPIGFIVLDSNGMIRLVNNAVLSMFNLNKTEIWQGKTLGQYFGLASLDEKIFQVLESEKSCNDSEFDRADGNSNRSYLADISLAHSSSGFKPPMGALSTKRGSITPSVC